MKEKMEEEIVNVYDGEEIIATVTYNNNLDMWTGSNWQNGGTGRHKGLTILEDGRYVLIHGTDWQGEKDHAEIITKQEALQEILRTGDHELLDEFNLRDEYEKKLIREKKTWAVKSIKLREDVYNKLTEKKRGNMSYNDVILMLLGEDKKNENGNDN